MDWVHVSMARLRHAFLPPDPFQAGYVPGLCRYAGHGILIQITIDFLNESGTHTLAHIRLRWPFADGSTQQHRTLQRSIKEWCLLTRAELFQIPGYQAHLCKVSRSLRGPVELLHPGSMRCVSHNKRQQDVKSQTMTSRYCVCRQERWKRMISNFGVESLSRGRYFRHQAESQLGINISRRNIRRQTNPYYFSLTSS
jgi:hypothetical protein